MKSHSSIFDRPSCLKLKPQPLPPNTRPIVLETVRSFALKHGYYWKIKLHRGWSTGDFDFDGTPEQIAILKEFRHDKVYGDWVMDLPATFGGDPEKVH